MNAMMTFEMASAYASYTVSIRTMTANFDNWRMLVINRPLLGAPQQQQFLHWKFS